MDESVERALARGRDGDGLVVVLTGAGISAESGIPTFRGEEGYWTVGSEVYHPQQMATAGAFTRMPEDVWRWYLYRRTVCRAAAPNPAHEAIAALETSLGERFVLVTQNVDGLHLRAGNTLERTYQVHGNIDFMRCSRECTATLHEIPQAVGAWDEARDFDDEVRALLVCPDCGARARPHVLWFDECYDEERFRFESSLRAAARADLLIVVGTSASTNLPWQVVGVVARRGAAMIDVNIADNDFGDIAGRLDDGAVIRATAAATLPALLTRLA